MSHYFDPSPSAASQPRTVTVVLPDDAFDFETDHGVFSYGRLDTGTKYLLSDAPTPPDDGVFLDLGCGAGPIALALARRRPRARVIAVDVNERARDLTERNARRLGVSNLDVVDPEKMDPELRFDLVWSNPPIKVGKAALHEMLRHWLGRLSPTGRAILVVQKNLGSDSLQRWLNAEGFAATRIGSRAGYRLLDVRPRPTAADDN
jgi:16S rRNA (guanine1207-N2)-methyltransferase